MSADAQDICFYHSVLASVGGNIRPSGTRRYRIARSQPSLSAVRRSSCACCIAKQIDNRRSNSFAPGGPMTSTQTMPSYKDRPFVLYHGWRSSASRRVRLCLAEKELDYESRLVNMRDGEQH